MGTPSGSACRVDAHCHFWEISREDYGWLTPENEGIAPLYRDFTASDLDPLAIEAGIHGRVLVQAAPTLSETYYLLALARKDPSAIGVVGWVDLEDVACVAQLEELSTDPLFLGVRPMLQDIADRAWLLSKPRADAMDALQRLNIRFDALVDVRHLDALATFVERMPELPVVINHAAKPPLSASAGDDIRLVWSQNMARLARHPNVFVKLSGLLTEMPQEVRRSPEEAARNLRSTFSELIDHFGPQRILWGSDWPVLTLVSPYAFWDRVTDILLADLGNADRADVLGNNARRFYSIKAANLT